MKTSQQNFQNLPNKKLRRLCRKAGLDKDFVFFMERDEMVSYLETRERIEKDARKAAIEAAKDDARGFLGLDYSKVLAFYKTMYNIKSMKPQDYTEMMQFWGKLRPLLGTDIVEDLQSVANTLKEMFCPEADFSGYSDEDLRAFIDDQIHFVNVSVFTDKLKKADTDIMKMSMANISFDSDVPTFDSTTVIHNKSSEDGISRMLDEKGLSSVTIFLGDTGMSPEEQALIDSAKEKLFRFGVTDRYSGKHYRFAFQNPSSCRKANFMFVEAETQEDVEKLWCEIAGLPSIASFKDAGLMDEEGKVIMAKLLARLSTRGSNSFNIDVVAESKWAAKVKAARIRYTKDVKEFISTRPYKTMVAPGSMAMVTPDPADTEEKKGWRKITPGDGQMIGSFEFHALLSVALRILSENQYAEFIQLWEKFGKDANNIPAGREGNQLRSLIAKIPGVFQIRHGEKKGICVRYNLEAVPELADIDAIVPDSVRKFVAGEWNQFPLEVCNWLKRKSQWVAMNPQFIEALAFDNPNSLRPIVDYWLDTMEESLTDIAKAQKFHGIIKATDAEDDSSRNPELVQALRTCSDLVHDAQVCNWRRDQYAKFINDMKIGRLLVPGMYTYMVCDPAYLLNKMFNLNLPHLQSGEFYFNAKECRCGMFRSPLIHPFEAQRVNIFDNPSYWYFKDVMVFNGYDGTWDRMGGGDFDGDTCGIVPDDDELGFGKIIVDGIRTFSYDIWEKGLSAKEVEFTFDNFVAYLVKSAKVDRTGVITNYASKALGLSNHLVSAIQFAKMMGCQTITLLHPKQFSEQYGVYGSKFVPQAMSMTDGSKTFVMKGFVKAKTVNGAVVLEENGLVGTFAFDDIAQVALKYLGLVEILRLLQGREIDGAKTGVYAEGVSGEDFIQDVKVVFTPHQMIVRQEHLSRPVANTSRANEYISLSPLARVHDYVQSQEHRILDHLANGQNFSFLLMTLLTEQEDVMLNGSYPLSDGSTISLKDFVVARKNAYNTAMHTLYVSWQNGQRSEEEYANEAKAMKEAECEFWTQTASAWGITMEVLAVALYIATYNKESQQHRRLTYGWLLPSELLSVFGRKNKKYELFRIGVKEISSAHVDNGYLYVNDKKYIAVNAENGPVAIQVFDGKNFALLHKKAEIVVAPRVTKVVADNRIYTIGTNGFKYHAAGDKEGWKALVANNGFMFDITLDNDSRAVLSINGQSISSLMMQNADFTLLGKKVLLVNNKSVSPIKETAASMSNMQVVIIGEA